LSEIGCISKFHNFLKSAFNFISVVLTQYLQTFAANVFTLDISYD
jgi:hypothetical protein